MGYFFDYLNIHQKDAEERFEILTQKASGDISWLVNAIFRYLLLAVVITNQVNSSHPFNTSRKSHSTGGNVVAYASNYRICLRRYHTDRIAATIIKSPYHLECKTNLTLCEGGIADYSYYRTV